MGIKATLNTLQLTLLRTILFSVVTSSFAFRAGIHEALICHPPMVSVTGYSRDYVMVGCLAVRLGLLNWFRPVMRS